MKITKRQLRRIIKEELNTLTEGGYAGHTDSSELEDRLNAVWDLVAADTMATLGGEATWEEIADEVMAAGYSIDPDLIETINLLPFRGQQKLFQKTFGAGRSY